MRVEPELRRKPTSFSNYSSFATIEQLRRLLDNSKTNEAALRDELAELREENLHLSLAGGNGPGDRNTDEVLYKIISRNNLIRNCYEVIVSNALIAVGLQCL